MVALWVAWGPDQAGACAGILAEQETNGGLAGVIGRAAWVRILGPSRAIRVFSKKLLRRRGVHLGVVWGASGHDEWMRVGPGVAGHEARGRRAMAGTAAQAGVVRQAHHEREAVQRERRQAWHERGQGRREWGEARGGLRRVQQDGAQAQQGRDQMQEASEQRQQK